MSSMNHHHHQVNGQIHSCPHLSSFRSHYGPKPFRFLQHGLRSGPSDRPSIRRDPPSEFPSCAACGGGDGDGDSSSRLYACLACAAVSCYAPPFSSHAVAHASSAPGHEIAVDVDRAELFCCACRDQVYDREFDFAVISQTAANSASTSSSHSSIFENLRKRRRLDYKPWSPDLQERVLVKNGSSALVGPDRDPEGPPWGLRGLNNLGNTCFMNSVLQSLLHTPPLRNYFLGDRHNRYYCQLKNANEANGGDEKMNAGAGRGPARVCLACDMDAMFSAFFSGDRKPYSPAKFLFR